MIWCKFHFTQTKTRWFLLLLLYELIDEANFFYIQFSSWKMKVRIFSFCGFDYFRKHNNNNEVNDDVKR